MTDNDWCEAFLTKECDGDAFLVPSCTAALELSCMMILEPGDEVIIPSWAFPSCANAVILRGAVPVFIDVDDNLNIDPNLIEQAITNKTKAIMPLHYAGVPAEMDRINAIAKAYGLYVIEDAAQAIGNWKATGDFGCLSFHYTKNVECGQGGAIIVKNHQFLEKAKEMMHCGTDKLKFYAGKQPYYDWNGIGSQYVMSEHQAKVLRINLERLEDTTEQRRKVWSIYQRCAPKVAHAASEAGNGHIFWFDVPDKWEWLKDMRQFNVPVTSHFDALHATVPGRKYGRAAGPIFNATRAMERLVKLNTGVFEDSAMIYAETVWPGSTAALRNVI